MCECIDTMIIYADEVIKKRLVKRIFAEVPTFYHILTIPPHPKAD